MHGYIIILGFGTMKLKIPRWVVFLVMLFYGFSYVVAATAPITEATLKQIAASLQMYVDELPLLPKLLGYTPGPGGPKPAALTIGMYQTSWVRACVAPYFFFFFF